jgi:hypothetical protein
VFALYCGRREICDKANTLHFRANTMNIELREKLLASLRDGSIVPYLGPGVLADVKNAATGAPIPAESDSLIIAMNGGKPIEPKLMYEFPRGAVREWIKALCPHYVIDINRDTQLQDSYADVPHNLIVGITRIGGTGFRYKLFSWDGKAYSKSEAINPDNPILFKPMGTPRPEANFIASDADYVDFITELMGGLLDPAGRKSAAQGQALSAEGAVPDPRYRAHGDVRYDLRRRPAGGLGADFRTNRQGAPLLHETGPGVGRGGCLRLDWRRGAGQCLRMIRESHECGRRVLHLPDLSGCVSPSNRPCRLQDIHHQ